jgi:hypothetical protein
MFLTSCFGDFSPTGPAQGKVTRLEVTILSGACSFDRHDLCYQLMIIPHVYCTLNIFLSICEYNGICRSVNPKLFAVTDVRVAGDHPDEGPRDFQRD